MEATIDILRGELERLFSIEQMQALCAEYLGFDAQSLGTPGAKGAYARTLVDRCLKDDAVEALVDAVYLLHPDADPKLKEIYVRRDVAELGTGANVGPYRISRKLGEGGVGIVYLGEKDAEKAAVKVVRRDHTLDRKAVQRYLTATRAMRTVKHDALLPVVGVGVTGDGRPWVATEYLDGLTLQARVARTGPMHYSEARPIVRAVLQALEALHARGLVHGDIKPENVLMERGPTNKARIALTDAGTDKLFGKKGSEVAETGPLPLFGTPKAMAPEVARGGAADRRGDLYGAGAMVYEILTGRPPFTGQNAMDLVVQHLTKEPEPPSKHAPRGWITPELDKVILQALSKAPSDRHRSALELLEAFEACSRAQEGGAAAETGAAEAPTATREDALAAASLLEENPDDESAAVELEKLAGGAHDWSIAIEAIEKVVEKVEDKQKKKDLLFRLARIHDAERKDVAAAEAAYQKILELDPDDDMAQVAMEELKKGAGDFEKVVEMLLEKVEKATEASERAASLREIARLYHKEMKDAGKAFDAISMAFVETPRDEAILRELEQITAEAKKWMDLVQNVAAQTQQPRAGDDAVALFCHLGRWYAKELGRPDFALPSFTQALNIDPASDAALEGISDIYRRAQQWQELAAMLERRADATPNPARARAVLAEAALLWEERLSDRARARTLYERVLAGDPGHPDSLAALERIYEKDGEWKKLVGLLAERAKTASGDARTELQVKIAEIHEDRLAQTDEAMDRFERVLEDDPQNLGALKGLERLYAKAGKFRELLTTLQSQLAIAATPRQKIALHERIGAIREEEFVEYGEAAASYEEVLSIDAHHEGALTALGRCYRLQKKWPDVVEILERHAKVVVDPKRRIELVASAGRILKDELNDLAAAKERFEAVLAADAENVEALAVVAEYAAQQGDISKSVEALDKLVDREADPTKKADGYVRVGKLLENGGELDQALARYKRALDVNPGHTEAAQALRGIFIRREDYGSALSGIEKELAITKGDLARARLFIEQGQIYREHVQDVEKAIGAFKTANGLDPTNVEAASPLAELLFENERWDEAVKIYETWTASADALPKEQRIRLFARLGIIRTKLGRTEAALDAFKKARQAAPDDVEVLRRLADVAYAAHDYGEARAMYAEYLARAGDGLDPAEHVQVVFRLGESKLECGDAAGAVKSLAEASAQDPRHEAALRLEARAHVALSQWDDAVRCKRALMELVDDDQRHDLLVEVGDLFGEKMGDRAKAAKSYAAALDIRPHDRTVLARLMAIYSADKDWAKLAETVVRLAEEIEDGLHRAKYHMTAAQIFHKEMDDAAQAATYYERALDEDPTMLKAFDGVVELLTSKQDWVGLEKSYRKMLFRLPKEGEDATKIRLWDAIAEIYHHRLQNPPEAVHAYEMAHDLDPDNRRRLETLVALYEADPKRFGEKAVAAHLDILRHSPYRIDSYKALRRIHTERKRPDEAWCLCAALTNLNMADPEEQGFFEKHRAATPAAATKVLGPDHWTDLLRHESEDPLLTGIFEALYPAVLFARARKIEEYDVVESDRQDVATSENAVGQMIHYASGVLGIPAPAFYFKDSLRQGMVMALTNPPAITAGSETWEWQDTQRTAFLVGRALAYTRRAAYVRQIVPTGTGLRGWVLAAIKTIVPQFPVPGDLAQPVNEALVAIDRRVMGPDRAQLTSFVNKLVQSAAEIDLKRWMAGIDHGCDRVGFLLANDLEVATAVIRKSSEHDASVGTKDRLREIILYAISDAYFRLRQGLGIALRAAA